MQTDMIQPVSPEKFISDILLHLNLSLSSFHDFPKGMVGALRIIGEFSHHDRVHIIEIHRDLTYSVRHEWNSKSFQPLSENRKHARLFYDAYLEEELCNRNYIMIREIQELSNPEMKAFLEEQHCCRLLLLPLFECGSKFAFIAFMQCGEIHDWKAEELRLLTDLSSVIAVQMHNYYLMRRFLQKLRNFKEEKEGNKILHSRLRRLHTEIIPAWEKLKNTVNSQQQQEIPEWTELERHMTALDEVCRKIPVK